MSTIRHGRRQPNIRRLPHRGLHPRRAHGSRGFNLVELVIVVAILGILAVLAMPNLLGAMDKSRQTATVNNMRTIAQGLERYAIENSSRYPVAEDLKALAPKLVPEYIKEMPLEDGWRNPFVYGVSENRGSFTLRSYGKDGEAQQEGTPPAADVDIYELDIIMVDGVFVQKPGSNAEEEDGEEATA